MTDETIKQMLEGMTQMARTMWNNPNLSIPNDIAEKYNVSEEFREKPKNDMKGEKE